MKRRIQYAHLFLVCGIGCSVFGTVAPTSIAMVLPIGQIPVGPIAAGPAPVVPKLPDVVTPFGTLTQTGNTGFESDLGIDGRGWFVLRDRENDQLYFTRWGQFHLDEKAYFVSNNGLRLQGYGDPSLTTIGDLRLTDLEAGPYITDFDITLDGKIMVKVADGRQFVRGQILFQDFGQPLNLARVGYRTYAATPAAIPSDSMSTPASTGLGTVACGWLDVTPEPVLLTHLPSNRPDDPMIEGALTWTQSYSDLGIVGKGSFIVRDTATSELFATRAGLFLQDGDGYLITYDGMRVQGFPDASSTITGDVRIEVQNRRLSTDPGAVASEFSISGDGTVMVYFSDGTRSWRGQVLLFRFEHPGRLVPSGYGRFSGVTAAQPQRLRVVGGMYGDGIRQGKLELINVTEDLLAIRQTLKFFLQGAHQVTGLPLDFALNGGGFFIVRQPGTAATFVTRDGAFLKDDAGYLVTSGGLRVQGFNDATLTRYGDIRIDGQGRPSSSDPSAGVRDFHCDRDGQLVIVLNDNTEFVCGQIILQDFAESYRLKEAGNGLYTNLAAAKPIVPALPPGYPPMGTLMQGALEMDYPAEQISLPPRNGFRLRLDGGSGTRWSIEASPNLIDWKELAVVDNPPNQMDFTDTESPSQARRFYRVVEMTK